MCRNYVTLFSLKSAALLKVWYRSRQMSH
uniref:Uncharacterized protein n=1 Tax=Arundo donax TaxID=35708 RepID=A0A0A9DPE2_ARUDO